MLEISTGLWIVIFVFVIALVAFCCYQNVRKEEQLKQYWYVYQGMPEFEMLSVMGEGYSRSILRNNRVKYEWRINARSTGYSYKGISQRNYTGVKSVAIYVYNGYVEEVRPHNI